MLVGMRLDVATCIRLGSESVVGVVGLHHSSAVGVGLAQLQLCVSRLKLIDSVRLNEKMFDESPCGCRVIESCHTNKAQAPHFDRRGAYALRVVNGSRKFSFVVKRL